MKDQNKIKRQLGIRRQIRARAKLSSSDRPRLSVFRSLKHMYAQIIDKQGKVLVAARDGEIKGEKMNGVARAAAVGTLIAQKALEKKVTEVVFDKGRFKYHGRVKALAEAAR
jgi:large subunit ribosomal protein L18